MVGIISMQIGVLLIITGGDHPLNQVNFTDSNSSPIELECGDIENWKTDIEIENYWVNRSIPNEYRDAVCSEGCDFSKLPMKLI